MRFVRGLLIAVVMLVFVLAALELGARVVMRGVRGAEIHARLADAAHSQPSEARGVPLADRVLQADEVVHPYLGYVTRPGRSAPGAPRSLDDLGFPNGGPFVTEADPRSLVVGVFGGSLAAQFVQAGGPQRIVAKLVDVAGLAGRKVIVVTTAQGGYKQPQSLLSLAYLLALGMHLDWVLLIDGVNDVVLPVVENLDQGAFPIFPRAWAWRVADLDVATDVRAAIGEIAFHRDLRRRIAVRFQASALRHSSAVSLVWLIVDRWSTAAIDERRRQLLDLRPKSLEYLATGPSWMYPDLYGALADVWKRSSIEMHALATGHDMLFAHFLQPNQYVRDSKPMSAEERALAISPEHPYRRPIEQGYPRLQQAGRELRDAGVAFGDTTPVFAHVTEPVYSDDCCHLNQRGNDVLADAMAAAIQAVLEAAPPRTEAEKKAWHASRR